MPTDNHFPIHFFTIVLNGEPFIRYHIEQFKKLPCAWHWHIVEGLADLKHDTAWSVKNGATLPEDVVKDGRSVDGTAEYLDQLAREFPDNITLYRAPNGRNWDGKLEMINAPLAALEKAGTSCLLWEIDSDELWLDKHFVLLRDMFLKNPTRFAAIFHCWYFVGPNLAINRRRPYQEIEWRRAWRYQPGMRWLAHEPPVLGAPVPGTSQMQDVIARNPFTAREMDNANLVFHHFAYVTDAQLEFKEKYYGYKDITAQWKRLQELTEFPAKLKDYFNWPWVHPNAIVEPVETCGILPLAHMKDGKWILAMPTPPWELVPPDERNAEMHRYINGWKFGYHLLPEVINRFDLKVGVEIGVAYGGHSDAILKRTGVTKLYGIDPYQHRPDYNDPMNFPQREFDGLHRNTMKFMAPHKERFELIREDSAAAAPSVPDPIDFVYIDGEHSYEGAKRDLENWYPKVREGGVISGHDYNHANFPGVTKAVQEFMDKEHLEINAGEEYFWWVRKTPVAERPTQMKPRRSTKRGILYVMWGKTSAVMERSVSSVRQVHPELPIHVCRLPDTATLLDKATLFDMSPFEETLFLDLDTIVLGRLEFGFEMAVRHGLACCICENPWARRYGGIKSGDLVEYNTGVLFFTRAAKPIFEGWKKYVRSVDSSILFHNSEGKLVKMPYNDQAGFSLAVAEAEKPPFILPFNWNFRPSWHRAWWGPIKIWHDYSAPTADIVKFSQDQSRPDAVIQFVRFN